MREETTCKRGREVSSDAAIFDFFHGELESDFLSRFAMIALRSDFCVVRKMTMFTMPWKSKPRTQKIDSKTRMNLLFVLSLSFSSFSLSFFSFSQIDLNSINASKFTRTHSILRTFTGCKNYQYNDYATRNGTFLIIFFDRVYYSNSCFYFFSQDFDLIFCERGLGLCLSVIFVLLSRIKAETS